MCCSPASGSSDTGHKQPGVQGAAWLLSQKGICGVFLSGVALKLKIFKAKQQQKKSCLHELKPPACCFSAEISHQVFCPHLIRREAVSGVLWTIPGCIISQRFAPGSDARGHLPWNSLYVQFMSDLLRTNEDGCDLHEKSWDQRGPGAPAAGSPSIPCLLGWLGGLRKATLVAAQLPGTAAEAAEWLPEQLWELRAENSLD